MKYIVECEKDKISFYRLKSKAWQIVTIKGRLYPVDDKIATKDRGSDTAFVVYDMDQTQPRDCFGTFINPDFVRALLDQIKLSNTKRKVWGKITGANVEKALTVIVIGGAFTWWILSRLGL